jgi:radical SAM superfamily enzyme YgiQ (UPF0313 family)
VHVLLISTYDLGRQPFGLASPAAWLREAGFDVHMLDLSRQPLDVEATARALLVAFFLPMHTATRLAVAAITRVRGLNAAAHLCAYGLYAPLNADLLRELGVSTILGGEYEADLVALAIRIGRPAGNADAEARRAITADRDGQDRAVAPARVPIPRLTFRVPDRTGLPLLDRYAHLRLPDGGQRVVAYTEASRGCLHRCRHCPIVPVYDGRFRVVPLEVVIGDVRRQVDAGAAHVTFGDPDFLNGPRHAIRVVEALARECPGLTYDVTIKIEHVVKHAHLLPQLAETGCAFVTSAVESIDDEVLARLEKGHTRADFERAAGLCREACLALAPTFVPFTPWTTIGGYVELLDVIEALDLVSAVPAVQLAIRLLIPSSSRLLELDDVRRLVGPFDRSTLLHPWRHPDVRVDALQREIEALVASSTRDTRANTFARVAALARARAGQPAAVARAPRGFSPGRVRARAGIPWLDEPWYC